MLEKLKQWQETLHQKLDTNGKLKRNQFLSVLKALEWCQEMLSKKQGAEAAFEQVSTVVEKLSRKAEEQGKGVKLTERDDLEMVSSALVAALPFFDTTENQLKAKVKRLSEVTSVQEKTDYFVVVDLEMTMAEATTEVGPSFQKETLEVAMLAFDSNLEQELGRFEMLVKPTVNPVLTQNCMDFTGLTQDMVNEAESFPEVALKLREFLSDYPNFRMLQWGTNDARQLKQDCDFHALVPLVEQGQPLNLSNAFMKVYELQSEKSVSEAMSYLGLEKGAVSHRAMADAVDTVELARSVFRNANYQSKKAKLELNVG